MAAKVTAGLVERTGNDSLIPSGFWLISPAGWLPRGRDQLQAQRWTSGPTIHFWPCTQLSAQFATRMSVRPSVTLVCHVYVHANGSTYPDMLCSFPLNDVSSFLRQNFANLNSEVHPEWVRVTEAPPVYTEHLPILCDILQVANCGDRM